MTENLSKYRPTLILLGILILAAILGYVWGSSSVKIADTGLWQLEPSYQGIYVQSVADAYSFDSNDALAIERLSYLCQENDGMNTALEQAAIRYGADPVKAANLDQLRTLINSGSVVQSEAVRVCSTSAVGGRYSGRSVLRARHHSSGERQPQVKNEVHGTSRRRPRTASTET